MKNYTIVHLTKFRDDTIINNGEKKKTKKTHKGRMKGKSQEVRREQVKNVVFINFIFYNPYLTAFIAVVNCGV